MQYLFVGLLIAAMLLQVYKAFGDRRLMQLVKSAAEEKGKVIDRPKHFWRQHHIFMTTKDIYKDFDTVLDKEFLSELGMGGGESKDGTSYVFFNEQFKGFKSYLSKVEDNGDGKYRYVFYVDEVGGSDGADGLYNEKILNVLLTEIEKTFVKLDENTEIKRELGKYDPKKAPFHT